MQSLSSHHSSPPHTIQTVTRLLQAGRCFDRAREILTMSTTCWKAVVAFKLPGTGSIHSNCVITQRSVYLPTAQQ